MIKKRYFDGFVERQQKTGICGETFRATGAMMWGGVMLGTALYLHLLGIPVGNLLAAIFGNPLLGT